jgi:excinuclease ABC subunit C
MVNPQEINFIPTDPGCYLFKDSRGNILYVGKAKNLKKRVSSYFQKRDHEPKTALLVSNIKDIDFIVTKSEVEALLLENNLIKKYYPKYNLDLKDSRRYAYILVHQDEIPWLEVARSREEKGEYYGPYVSGTIRRLIMDVLTRQFRVLTRKPSPKLKKIIVKDEYLNRLDQVRKILKGEVDSLIDELQEKMSSSAKKTYFEHALSVRNQIAALQTLKEKQIMEMTRSVDAHIINYKVISEEVYLLIFSIRKGVLEEKQQYTFPFYEGVIDDFILQYYDQAPIPQEIIVPHEVDPALEECIQLKSSRTVHILIPQKGDKKDLLDLVALNINSTFFAGSERTIELKNILSLDKIPHTIECFDISHLGGTNTVASMVSFFNGMPQKSNYRKFKIRAPIENDDYMAMREVVKRRYSGSLTKSLKLPDLIVIDGGPGQLSSAVSILKELNIKVPVIALAKRIEEIYLPNTSVPLVFSHKNKGLQLLQAIRDEAHRFAISYQRLLRQKSLLT